MKTIIARRLPLKTTYNTRELGGYHNKKGQITNWQAFIRSDDISFLNGSDITYVKEYGVKTVIDLRSIEERREIGYPLSLAPGVACLHIPLNAEAVTDATKVIRADRTKFLPTFYIQCLEEKEKIKAILTAVSIAGPGGILFHCAAGKDRTGIVAMLILGLAEVSRADILSDYEVTYGYIKSNPKFLEHTSLFPQELLFSKREYLEKTLDYIDKIYGGIVPYLVSTGLTNQQLSAIKSRFLK